MAFDPFTSNRHMFRSHFPSTHTFFFCKDACPPAKGNAVAQSIAQPHSTLDQTQLPQVSPSKSLTGPNTSWAFFYVIHSSQLSFFASQFIRWKDKVTGQSHTVTFRLNPSSSGIVFLPLPSHTDFSALRVPPAIIFVLITPLALVQYVFSVSSASCAAQTPLKPILQQVQPILLSVSQIHLLSSSSATALLRPQHTSHGRPQVCFLALSFQIGHLQPTLLHTSSERAFVQSQHITSFCDTPPPTQG